MLPPLTRKLARSKKGTTAIEMPVVLLFLFVFILLPLIDLGTVALRTSAVYMAANDALQVARKAQSFKADGSATEGGSAITLARRVAGNVRDRGLRGVLFEDSDVVVRVIGIPIKSGLSPIRTSEPLTELKQQDYMYELEVVINARVEPLIVLNSQIFGSIQGLTTPVPITAQFKGFAERPQGLVK